MMEWIDYASYFFGALFFVNGVPHFVSGVTGRRFQSPFAKPPGRGLSSPAVNVLWGAFNMLVAYVLIGRIGNFDLRSNGDIAAVGTGALIAGLTLARTFGRFHGGDAPPRY